jgi:hypothetical protein
MAEEMPVMVIRKVAPATEFVNLRSIQISSENGGENEAISDLQCAQHAQGKGKVTKSPQSRQIDLHHLQNGQMERPA